MGVTISYRGRLRKPRLVETFEDRIVDLAIELGGYARIWRSANERDPERVVRGVMLDLAPGLETLSLLISPEGDLIPLSEIEQAEKGPLEERPWIFMKTQFGGLDAHVAVVALLDALRADFFPDLEVQDEGEYWEKRDLQALRQKFRTVQQGLSALGRALEREPFSPEAAEDPQIVANRVARVAERVKRTLARPPEHAPVHFSDSDPSGDGSEAEWDAMYRHNERTQAGLTRAMEERTLRGQDSGEAFEESMRSEGITDLPSLEEDQGDDETVHGFDWNDAEEEENEFSSEAETGDKRMRRLPLEERHPLLKRMSALTVKVLKLPERKGQELGGPLDPFVKGILEMSGGLAQVLSTFAESDDLKMPKGQRLAQLKRALRGAAFARGALYPARSAKLIGVKDFRYFLKEVEEIEREIQADIRRTRESF